MPFKGKKCKIEIPDTGKSCGQPTLKDKDVCRFHFNREKSSKEQTIYIKKKELFKNELIKSESGDLDVFDDQVIHILATISTKLDIAAKDGISINSLIPISNEILKILRSLRETRDTRITEDENKVKTAIDFENELKDLIKTIGIPKLINDKRKKILEYKKKLSEICSRLNLKPENNTEIKLIKCELCSNKNKHYRNLNNDWKCVECGNLSVSKLHKDPHLFGKLFLKNHDETFRSYRWYQKEDLLCKSRKIIHQDGRAVGKTINLSTLVLWFTYVNKGKSLLVAAPYQSHVNSITDEIEFQIYNNEKLYSNVAKNKGKKLKITRKPYYQIHFKNRCIAYFRPAGVRGESFRSLHVDYLLVDEAAWMPEAAWNSLRQCLNPNGFFRIYSTPNGLRDRTYYSLTKSNDWTIFKWPSWIAPTWSKKQAKELVNFYNGENTAGYKHEVAGKHGAPTYGAFDPSYLVNAFVDIEDYRKINVNGKDFDSCESEQEIRDRIQNLLNLPGGHGKYFMGADFGYTSDPSEILLFKEDTEFKEANENTILKLMLRIHAKHVPYPIICEVISLLDTIYSVNGIGIDRGGNGMSVEHELLHLDKFRDKNFNSRLTGYDFGGTILVGEDEMGRPAKKRTKEHMTDIINKLIYTKKLQFPKKDTEIEDQFYSHTYTIGQKGIIYSRGNDHVIDAIRCAVLKRAQILEPVYERKVIRPTLKPVIIKPKW